MTTSSAALGQLVLRAALLMALVGLVACTPFPRKDSVDTRGTTIEGLTQADVEPDVLDSIQPEFQFNNNNLIAEPGETVQVTVWLSWAGDTPRSVSIDAVASDSEGGECVASALSRLPSLALPAVMTETAAPVGPIEVRLQQGACDPGVAAFDLRVTVVDTSSVLTIPVSFPVMDRDSMVALQGVTITDGDDGALSPGETSTLTVDVKNDGVSTLRTLGITISDNGTCVSASSNGISGRLNVYGDVFAGQVVTMGGNTLSVTADSACAAGDSLELTFLVEDAAGDQFELPFSTTLQ